MGYDQKLVSEYREAISDLISAFSKLITKSLTAIESHFHRTASVVVGTTSSFGATVSGVSFDKAFIDESSSAKDLEVM